ncbi:MAG: peptidoglycan DD-metalloendopeptidase family protein, partial [Gluconacetobacter diazotrophicus]|nr:peptidoglycan DD-metalloendopeptidase family protein [Gluconacetobacter diazotrophicus]
AADALGAAIRQIEAAAAREAEARARRARTAAARAAPPPPAGPGLWAGSGGAAAPVPGRVSVAYGSGTEAGPATGTTYASPAGAPVAAPCSGRVEFSGPFRSFGNMLILDCGGGYRFVLAGMDRIDARVGQVVSRRTPVGSSGGGGLYVQLRRGDAPVDPGRFLPR